MKNKIIKTSLASAVIVMGLVWITNANFANVSSEDRESHRTIMNKLMDGETLTSSEQVILDEMKLKRTENEELRAERQAKKDELAPIFEKKKAGEDLTEAEQTKLDDFKAERQENGNKMWGKRGGKGWKMWWKEWNRKGWFDGECQISE